MEFLTFITSAFVMTMFFEQIKGVHAKSMIYVDKSSKSSERIPEELDLPLKSMPGWPQPQPPIIQYLLVNVPEDKDGE